MKNVFFVSSALVVFMTTIIVTSYTATTFQAMSLAKDVAIAPRRDSADTEDLKQQISALQARIDENAARQRIALKQKDEELAARERAWALEKDQLSQSMRRLENALQEATKREPDQGSTSKPILDPAGQRLQPPHSRPRPGGRRHSVGPMVGRWQRIETPGLISTNIGSYLVLGADGKYDLRFSDFHCTGAWSQQGHHLHFKNNTGMGLMPSEFALWKIDGEGQLLLLYLHPPPESTPVEGGGMEIWHTYRRLKF